MEKVFPIFSLEGKGLTASILGDKWYKNLKGLQLCICNLPFNICFFSVISLPSTILLCQSTIPFPEKKFPVFHQGGEGQLPRYTQW